MGREMEVSGSERHSDLQPGAATTVRTGSSSDQLKKCSRVSRRDHLANSYSYRF